MAKETEAKTIPKGLHASEHETGGVDEIDITDLAGLTADAQIPTLHGPTHESGGGDEIDVAGLIGLLADPQTPLAHSHLTIEAGNGALVYDAAAPNAWTDLNLSGTIGAQASFVILKIDIEYKEVAFRKNGDTTELFSTAANTRGCSYAEGGASGNGIILIVLTDASGICEWKCEDTTAAKVYVLGYIK